MKYFSQEFVEEEAEDSDVESNLTMKQKTANHIDRFTYGVNDNFVNNSKDFSKSIEDAKTPGVKTFEGIPEIDATLEE